MGIDNIKSRIIEEYKGWHIVRCFDYERDDDGNRKLAEDVVFCYNNKTSKKSYGINGHPYNTLESAIRKARLYIDKQTADKIVVEIEKIDKRLIEIQNITTRLKDRLKEVCGEKDMLKRERKRLWDKKKHSKF